MNQAQLIHSAKQGDTTSIITLLNQSLTSRRVEIFEAVLEENALLLKLRSFKVPNQHKLVPFISEELATLGIHSLDRLTIHGFTGDAPHPLWEKSITLDREHSLVNHVAKIESRSAIVEESVENEVADNESAENPEAERPFTWERYAAMQTNNESAENPEAADTGAERVNEDGSESAQSETIERSLPAKRALDPIPATNSRRSWLSLGMTLAFLSIGFGFGLLTGNYIGYQRAAGELSPSTEAIEPSR